MYSHEDKMRTIELYLRYDRSAEAVINELGYPNRQTLMLRYMEFAENGDLSRGRHRRYDDLQKRAAVDHFFDHVQCLTRTVRQLGYPKSKELLASWADELEPGRSRRRAKAGSFTDAPENLVKRNSYADVPNKLWLTDITEFRIPADKFYLSTVVDCFNGMVVSWPMSTSPNAELANAMLDAAATLSEDEPAVAHTDRGRPLPLAGLDREKRSTASRGRCRRKAALRTTAPARASSGA